MGWHRRPGRGASGVDAAPDVAVAVGAARGGPQAVAGQNVPRFKGTRPSYRAIDLEITIWLFNIAMENPL